MIKDCSKLLSICIPTYNGEPLLRVSIEKWIEKIKPYNLKIFISDNASTDNTKELINEFLEIYPQIFYHCNEANIGPDKNFSKALSISDTKFRWLMGNDDMCDGNLEDLLKILETDYDAVLLNYPRIIEQVSSEEYTDMNKLMFDLGASTTFMSCMIFNERIIKNKIFEDVYKSNFANINFAHSAGLFSYVASKDSKVYYMNNFKVKGIFSERTPWADKAFHYFVNNLSLTAKMLPSTYIKKSKNAYSRKIRTHFFGNNGYFLYTLDAKYAGKFSLAYFFKSHANIKIVFNLPQRFILFKIALYPKFLIKFSAFILKKVYHFFKYTLRGKRHPDKIIKVQETN